MKKMNNKGFTLVELLATIAIVAIISSVTIVTIISYAKKSEEKAENAFYKQLENYVEDYISLVGINSFDYNFLEIGTSLKIKSETDNSISTVTFDNNDWIKKCFKDVDGNKCSYTLLYLADENPNFDTIVDEIVNKKVVNPVTKKECKNDNLKIQIYRDYDYVYCLTIAPDNTTEESCVSKVISTCENLYKYNDEGYITFNE